MRTQTLRTFPVTGRSDDPIRNRSTGPRQNNLQLNLAPVVGSRIRFAVENSGMPSALGVPSTAAPVLFENLWQQTWHLDMPPLPCRRQLSVITPCRGWLQQGQGTKIASNA